VWDGGGDGEGDVSRVGDDGNGGSSLPPPPLVLPPPPPVSRASSCSCREPEYQIMQSEHSHGHGTEPAWAGYDAIIRTVGRHHTQAGGSYWIEGQWSGVG
jgi:hypothetical protein